MTLRDLENSVLEHFNDDTDKEASVPRLRIRRHLNEWHRRILTTPGLERLRAASLTFNSVASTATYALLPSVARILRIYETTNDQVLAVRDLEWYRQTDPDPATGTPEAWVPLGFAAVGAKPASTGLWVVSDSSSDTTPSVYVQGILSGGLPVETSVVLNGLTRRQVGGWTTFIDVSRVTLSAPCVGFVNVYNAAAGGSILGQIRPGATSARYVSIALWPTPASAVTYTVDYEREVLDLALATDEPFLPVDFHYLLAIGARISEYEKRQDPRQPKAEAHYSEGLRRLMFWVMHNPYQVYVPGGTVGGRSRLGPWFPAGT